MLCFQGMTTGGYRPFDRLRPVLPAGGTIAIVAPAGGVPSPDWMNEAIRYFAGRGHEARLVPGFGRSDRYLADGDAERAAALVTAFADPSIAAVLALRGGYGSARILDRLDWPRMAATPKPLLGFSDITALNLALLRRTGMVSFTGLNCVPDLKDGVLPALNERTLWLALRGEELRFGGLEVQRPGHASGPLIGGCLSILTSLLGTDYLPDLTGAILFIEDVNEEPYRVDRMVNQLRLAGVFRRVAGVALGSFVHCEPKNPEDGPVDRVLEEVAGMVDGPVVSGLPYGHTPERCVLPVGAHAELTAPDDGFGHLSVQ